MKMNAIIILSLLLKLAVSIPDADNQLHIYALPVGQGDCTVIQCPRGEDDPTKGVVTIIDAGSSNNIGMDGDDIVQFLEGTRLNFVVITHSHADHYSYVDDILNYYEKEVTVYHSCDWDSYGVESEYAIPERVHKCVSIEDCEKHVLEMSLCPSDSYVTLSFVASPVGECAGDPNSDSIISKITYAGISTLITGDFDLTQNAMELFLQTAGLDLESDIYKLSHHGALNANPDNFLDAIGARYVFSSSGYRYGHPRCEVYDYYNARLPDNAVDEHPYTCFNRNGSNNYVARNVNTDKAIFVTSVYEEEDGQYVERHLVLMFSINEEGHIIDDFWEYFK